MKRRREEHVATETARRRARIEQEEATTAAVMDDRMCINFQLPEEVIALCLRAMLTTKHTNMYVTDSARLTCRLWSRLVDHLYQLLDFVHPRDFPRLVQCATAKWHTIDALAAKHLPPKIQPTAPKFAQSDIQLRCCCGNNLVFLMSLGNDEFGVVFLRTDDDGVLIDEPGRIVWRTTIAKKGRLFSNGSTNRSLCLTHNGSTTFLVDKSQDNSWSKVEPYFIPKQQHAKSTILFTHGEYIFECSKDSIKYLHVHEGKWHQIDIAGLNYHELTHVFFWNGNLLLGYEKKIVLWRSGFWLELPMPACKGSEAELFVCQDLLFVGMQTYAKGNRTDAYLYIYRKTGDDTIEEVQRIHTKRYACILATAWRGLILVESYQGSGYGSRRILILRRRAAKELQLVGDVISYPIGTRVLNIGRTMLYSYNDAEVKLQAIRLISN